MHRRLGNATLSQLVFSGENDPNFPREKSHWDNIVVKRKKKRKKKKKEKYIIYAMYRHGH